MKKAWISNGVVIDAVSADPRELFHPDVAKQYSGYVDDDILPGAQRVGKAWVNPPAAAATSPIVAPSPTVGPNEFFFLWTLEERVAIETIRKDDVAVALFMRQMEDARTTEVILSDPVVQVAVRHTVAQLVAAGAIPADREQARVDAIIAGTRP